MKQNILPEQWSRQNAHPHSQSCHIKLEMNMILGWQYTPAAARPRSAPLNANVLFRNCCDRRIKLLACLRREVDSSSSVEEHTSITVRLQTAERNFVFQCVYSSLSMKFTALLVSTDWTDLHRLSNLVWTGLSKRMLWLLTNGNRLNKFCSSKNTSSRNSSEIHR